MASGQHRNIGQYGATHWGRVTHICVSRLTITGSDNGLSPERRQAIICTCAGILLIRPLGTNFSEILIGVQTLSFKKMEFNMSSAKWRPFCLGLNVLNRFDWLDCGSSIVNSLRVEFSAKTRTCIGNSYHSPTLACHRLLKSFIV